MPIWHFKGRSLLGRQSEEEINREPAGVAFDGAIQNTGLDSIEERQAGI
jgi:hypothetical protein